MTLEFWQGEFGDEYTERNNADPLRAQALHRFWGHFLGNPYAPEINSILEVGANVGANLRAISRHSDALLCAVEPNKYAASQIKQNIRAVEVYGDDIWSIDMPDQNIDIVFTSGVLIHVHPDRLREACQEIYRVSKKYILCVEYFSDTPREVSYRGNEGKLWTRDFGSFWVDNFDLKVLSCEFFWRHTTGMDNVTAWLLEKT